MKPTIIHDPAATCTREQMTRICAHYRHAGILIAYRIEPKLDLDHIDAVVFTDQQHKAAIPLPIALRMADLPTPPPARSQRPQSAERARVDLLPGIAIIVMVLALLAVAAFAPAAPIPRTGAHPVSTGAMLC